MSLYGGEYAEERSGHECFRMVFYVAPLAGPIRWLNLY